MRMLKKSRRIASSVAMLAVLLPLSLFGDSRRLARTSAGDAQSLDGYMRSVRNRGREISILSSFGLIDVVSDRSTPVYYRGQRFRTDDLETGDRLRVFGGFDRDTMYAQTIEVLRSVSEGHGDDRHSYRRRGDDDDRRFNRRHGDDDDDDQGEDDDDDD